MKGQEDLLEAVGPGQSGMRVWATWRGPICSDLAPENKQHQQHRHTADTGPRCLYGTAATAQETWEDSMVLCLSQQGLPAKPPRPWPGPTPVAKMVASPLGLCTSSQDSPKSSGPGPHSVSSVSPRSSGHPHPHQPAFWGHPVPRAKWVTEWQVPSIRRHIPKCRHPPAVPDKGRAASPLPPLSRGLTRTLRPLSRPGGKLRVRVRACHPPECQT